MKEYTYRGTRDSQVVGVVAVVLAVGYVVVTVVRNIPKLWQDGEPLEWLFSGLIVALVLAAGCFIGLYYINLLPTVWVTDEYLIVSAFRRRRVRIRWQDIVDIRELAPSMYYPPNSILIRARHISFFHHVYGIICARSLLPAFVVHKGIVGYEELLVEIRRRAEQARSSLSLPPVG